ncbi:c-type cytochrome [Sphingomonas solaris]|uniref:Cytochrome c family protein n=1 Tax=Alterirhizorhabdus solaris TaxID=2529389 RepID=A0A558QT36_9SPHN|nr:cytochrome c family protein [Sphingomonas solaris]TVV70310.1 cytochrome c family protein [Sphingomonas solaris]
MDDRTNTIAGWALAGGIAALGLSIVSGEYFHAERPEKMGYVVEGVEEEAGGDAAAPAQPIEFYLASADPAKGADVFKKCAACHNADKGGANALGPNLWGVLGESIGKGANGFPFSDALSSKGGTWAWGNLNEWLTSPKKFAPGTKMTFAGLSKPEDRANVIAYLNQQSDSPLPMPAAPAAGAAPAAAGTPAADGAPAEGGPANATGAPTANTGSTEAAKGKDVPVQTEAQAAASPKGNIAGDAAPATSGTAKQEKH